MKDALNWFEIFVEDMPRAVAFYEGSLSLELKEELFGGMPFGIFPAEGSGVRGALVKHPVRCPSAEGAIVYLNVAGQLDEVLRRVPESGGAVMLAKTDIGEPGHIALIRDTEGNVVGLHAPR
jgi:predicted enzyme related to lactoylglutathione lyase